VNPVHLRFTIFTQLISIYPSLRAPSRPLRLGGKTSRTLPLQTFRLERFPKIVYSLTTMKITLEIPDASLWITKERPEEFARSLRIAAAVKWYELGRISQSKAAELIGCSRIELFNHLREYGVSFLQIHEDDLEQEVADLRI